MTYSPTLALTLLKARIKKYKYRRPKPGGGYKYYYAEHHGGGITSAAFEAGSAFKLTFKGRRGHFHIKSVDGDMITISHDARPGVEIPPIHRDELRALLEKQHSKAETKSREKAQRNRRKKRKKRKSTKRKKTQTPRELTQQGADNFETMPEEPRNLKTARRELKEKEEILEGSKRAGTSADKLAEIERELADKRAKVEVLEEDHFSNVFADKLRSSAESAKGKQLIDALAEAHEKREGVEAAERALIDFYKETALKRKGSPERLKDRELKDLRNIQDRWLESDEDTLYDSLKEEETEARQIYFEHVSLGDSSPYTQAQVDAAVKRQTERGARAEALKFAYTEGMLRTAQELKAQDETAQPTTPKIKRMSAAERKALDSDLAKALREGDADAAHELIKRDQIDYAQTGNSTLDNLLSQAISAGEVETFDDATKKISGRGKLSAEQLSALEQAARRGVLNSTTQGDLEVYALNSSADPDRSLTLLVKGDKFELKIDDFRPPNARDQRAIPEGKEQRAPIPKQKLDEALSAIQALLEKNPDLASDPRVAALIGPQSKPKREGRADQMFLTIDGRERKAEFRYQLIEAGDAIPSHDPLSFSKREDYPEGIQERIYHQDRMEQLKVQRNAGSAYEPSYLINTNPDATNGPPIVTPDGIVLGGNSRVMSTQLVHMNNPEGRERYRQKLSQDAAIYGFSQADIDAMDNPMLVRVYEPEQTDKKHMAKLVRAMNENKTQGMDERTAGRAAAAKVSQRTLKTLQQGLDKFPTFSFNRFMTRPSKALDAFKEALYSDGILNAQNASQLIRSQDGTFTATGREFMQYMLTGYVVNDDRLLPTLDYATMEQLTVSLGKFAAAGIGEAERSSLQNAIAIYNNVISRDLLPQKGGKDLIQKRNRVVDIIMLEEQELGLAEAGAEGSDSDELSVSKIPIGELKERVRNDPLSSAFLKILTLNPGTKRLENTVERFIKLVEDTGQSSLFGGDEVLDYSEAANKLAKELSETHEIEARLYDLPEKTRKGSPLLDLYKAIRC